MPSSSAHMRRLGAELRRLRTEAGLTQVKVAEAVGRSHPTIVNWERGKTRMSKSDLVCLLAELQAPDHVRHDLELLRQQTGRGGTEWTSFNLPRWLRPVVSFEEDAARADSFEPLVVPGFLQTEAYAREMHDTSQFVVSAEDAKSGVAARMQRQARLTGTDPLVLDIVIGEAALRLAVGGAAVMVPQLERLLLAAASATITLRVLPFAAGAHPGLAGNLTVLHFAEPIGDPPVAYFDGPNGIFLITEPADVDRMVEVMEDLRGRALSPSDSRVLVSAILTEFREPKESP